MLSLTLLLVATTWPRNMAIAAGGFSMASRELTNHCWRDPKSGLYALKTMECDGAHRGITITKDRRVISSSGYNLARFGKPNPDGYTNQVEDKAFVPATKHGVRYGDWYASVIRRLGNPQKSVKKGSRNEFTCLLYKKVIMQNREEGEVLRNTYIFKAGKLIEIEMNLDAIPGCGDDGRSDEGWPWTKF